MKNTLQVDAKKLEPIRDWLAAGGEKLQVGEARFDFCYSEWNTVRRKYMKARGHCGTLCCVGGAIEALYRKEICEKFDVVRANYVTIGAFVGLDEHISDQLFFPSLRTGSGRDGYDLPAEEVAKVLTHLMETNKLDWSIV